MTAVTPFGVRLAEAMQRRGPLCVGVDPHASLLRDWGLSDDVAGLERFTFTVVEALAGQVAVLKPQVAFFERHGSRGLAVLERAVAEAGSGGALVLNDAKRGDIGSTMQAYADAWLDPTSRLCGDAVTVTPFLGFGALEPALASARRHGKGLFVLALTSNPEGASVQHARTPQGRTVAQVVLEAAADANAVELSQGDLLGPVGAVIGATIGAVGRCAAGSLNIGGALLAPGVGAQGAGAAELREVFAGVESRVLPSVSREVLRAGPSVQALRAAAEAVLDECRAALMTH